MYIFFDNATQHNRKGLDMKSEYVKGQEIYAGKTKTVYAVIHSGVAISDLVICENRNDITADDDPNKTRQFATKAEYATTTTCNVFELLDVCDIPTVYRQQLTRTSFLAKLSEMISLEIIIRRLPVGSYLKRQPNLITSDSMKPYRFHRLEFELFLKTSGQHWKDQKLPCDDPWIVDPYSDEWQLAAPKAPLWDVEAQKPFFTVDPASVLGNLGVEYIEALARKVFLVLECAWSNLGHKIVDFKLEIDSEGRVSDVVDNDSWRLLAPDGEQLDKQVFRDHGDAQLSVIEENYGRVARLSERFRVPKQALVLWKASPRDTDFDLCTQLPKGLPGVEIIEKSGSAHKNSARSLQELESIFRDFPDGGVVVTKVGRSNGIGATFAAHSPWPVITLPDTYKDFPDDIHSSVRCPSAAPSMVCWPADNAILAALKLLGQTNPAVYAHVQSELEELDSYFSL